MIQYIALYIIVILFILIYKKDIANTLTTLYDGSVCEPLANCMIAYHVRRTSYATLCLSKGKKNTILEKKEYNVKELQKYYNQINQEINKKITTFNDNYKVMNDMYNKKKEIDNLCISLYASLKKEKEHMMLTNKSQEVISKIISNSIVSNDMMK